MHNLVLGLINVRLYLVFLAFSFIHSFLAVYISPFSPIGAHIMLILNIKIIKPNVKHRIEPAVLLV